MQFCYVQLNLSIISLTLITVPHSVIVFILKLDNRMDIQICRKHTVFLIEHQGLQRSEITSFFRVMVV